MNDEELIIALASMSDAQVKDFCKRVMDHSITLNISYDNYVSLTLLFMKYFDKQ